MEAELHAAINESLRTYIFPNAIFYAERLHSLCPSLVSLATLANCHLASGDATTCARLLSTTPFESLASSSLESSKSLDGQRKRCWYLLGVACAQSERFAEAETALLHIVPSDDGAAEYWLGICGKRLGRTHAPTNFRSSFERCPALFVAYEELVALQRPPDTLASNGGPVFANVYKEILQEEEEASQKVQTAPAADGAHPGPLWGASEDVAHQSNSRFSAPPPPRSIPSAGSQRKSGGQSASSRGTLSSPPPVPSNRGPGSPTKRGSFTSALNGWGVPLASRRSPAAQPLSVGLVRLLASYAEVVALMGSFQCREAIERLTTDPILERDALWQAPNMAMCNFHLGETAEARTHFDRMRQTARWKLHDVRIIYYSTVLWHQRDGHALGHLAQIMMEQAPLHVTTLAVAGNCYSLSKDSKMAAQVLTRATKLDKSVAYVCTLLGYELLAVHPERAEAAFMDALKLEPRHYMAMAGLGELAYRTEAISKAQHYFTAALSVNRQPTVMNRLAGTYHRRGATKENLRTALEIYDACLQRSPSNVGARHHRAEVLMRMHRFEDALFELERLRVDCPEEAALFMSLGRCAHRLGRVAHANQYYHKVLDLDPRRSVAAKACLERLQQNLPPDDEE